MIKTNTWTMTTATTIKMKQDLQKQTAFYEFNNNKFCTNI